MRVNANLFYKQLKEETGIPIYKIRELFNAMKKVCINNYKAGHYTVLCQGMSFRPRTFHHTVPNDNGERIRYKTTTPTIVFTKNERIKFREATNAETHSYSDVDRT